LAIICYERIMPGSQLANRLQDLKYRVLAVNNPAQLAAIVLREAPLLVFVDLEARGDVCDAIRRIKADAATAHVPVIAFARDTETRRLDAAHAAGAGLIVGESRLTGHLPQIIEQALQID
jgi:CheY-like chemotaxis protein